MAGSSDETAGHHTNASSTLHIHPDKTQIGTARRFVQQTLGTWGLSTQTAELQVAASELVTNAIMHGQGAVDVTLMHLADRLRLEVVDQGFGPRPIQIRTASATSQGGWGLRLVDTLSDRWGADRRPGHTLVWMERQFPTDDHQNGTHERDTAPNRPQTLHEMSRPRTAPEAPPAGQAWRRRSRRP
jgi:anti-sigma regulatory factor (Ser/Thr protein kinase)